MASPIRARAVWMLDRLTGSKVVLLDSWGNAQKRKSHQPRLRVVAWVLDQLNPFRQAQFPARTLWVLIRMAGIRASPRTMVRRGVLEVAWCMTLMEVTQRRGGRVKKRGSWPAIPQPSGKLSLRENGSL